MSSESMPRPTRGRVARAVEEGQRRRRRDPNDNGVVKRLHVPENVRAELSKTHHLRWVVDAPGRIAMLEGQDWDLVSDEELGVPATRHADVAQNRMPLQQRLMKKPLDYYEEDHAARQKRIDQNMKAAELGQTVLNGPDSSEGLSADDPRVYLPHAAQANKL